MSELADGWSDIPAKTRLRARGTSEWPLDADKPAVPAQSAYIVGENGRTYRVDVSVPAQPAPTPDMVCEHCGNAERGHWPDGRCKGFMFTPKPIPPTSAPTPEPLADICPSCGETDKTKRMPCANAWHDGYVSQLEAERNKLGREVLTASAEIASLKRQLAERKMCPECDRWMSQLSNGPTEYKYVCEFCELLKENDQLEAEIAELKRQLAEAERKGWNEAIEAAAQVVPNSFPTGVIHALAKGESK